MSPGQEGREAPAHSGVDEHRKPQGTKEAAASTIALAHGVFTRPVRARGVRGCPGPERGGRGTDGRLLIQVAFLLGRVTEMS